MKFLTLCLAFVSITAFAADNVYIAGGNSIDATSHAPAAIKSVDDGSAQQLSVGETATQITPTLVVTATTYTPGLLVGGKLTFTGVVRENGGSAALRSICVVDSNSTANSQPLQLVLFDTPTLTGTYTDHVAPATNAADIAHIIRVIPITAANYTAVSSALSVADVDAANRVLKLSGTTSCAGLLLVASGTATMSGTNTMALKIGVRQN